MASKLLLLPRSDYEPYLSVLPETVSLPACWNKDDVDQLQSEYMIERVRVCFCPLWTAKNL